MAKRMKAGDILRLNFQADVYQRRYELVERTGPKTWLCRYLPLEPDKVEQMRADPYTDEDQIAREEADTGTTFTQRFVTAAEYARYF